MGQVSYTVITMGTPNSLTPSCLHRFIAICLFSMFSLTISAQAVDDSVFLSNADRFAESLSKEKNFITLAEKIVDAFPDDLSRARAAFRWITDQIRYDYKFVNRGDELDKPDCGNNPECGMLMKNWETGYLRKIMSSRKTTAEGYAKLFKKLCDLMYIPCEYIQGYARTKPYQIGNNMGANHFWNAIYIHSSWYYCDPTWAAGYCTEDDEGLLTSYVRQFEPYYWLQKQDRFFRNHYPKKGFLVEPLPFSKEQFFNKPFYFSAKVLDQVKEVSPATGVIKCRKGDSILFSFYYLKNIEKIQVNSNIFRNPPVKVWQKTGKKKYEWVTDEWAMRKQQYAAFARDGNLYSLYVPVKHESLYYIELVFDGTTAIRYRIRVEP